MRNLESEDLGPTAPIQADPVPESVATTLREAREGHGSSLRDVAAALNIRYVYLEAIEDREFDKLPGTTYAIGFLRSYAEHLGLDGAEVINRFKAEVAGLDKRTQLVFPTPVPEGKGPGGALILVSVLFLALAYGTWSYFSGQDERVAELVPAGPERLQDLLGENPAGPVAAPVDSAQSAAAASMATDSTDPVDGAMESGTATSQQDLQDETASGQSAEAVPSSLETTPFETAPIGSNIQPAEPADVQAATRGDKIPSSSPAPAAGTASGSVAPSEQSVTVPGPEATTAVAGQRADPSAPDRSIQTATAAPAPEAIPDAPTTGESAVAYSPLEAQVYGRGNVDARIILRATQDSWVQVRDSKEDLLFTRVLRSGDSYRVPNQAGLTLLTGNAGGLDVEVDGTYLGALGPVGSVRRNVILEPGKLRDGAVAGQ
jgi:cytoskeletal protein RodZ